MPIAPPIALCEGWPDNVSVGIDPATVNASSAYVLPSTLQPWHATLPPGTIKPATCGRVRIVPAPKLALDASNEPSASSAAYPAPAGMLSTASPTYKRLI